MWTAQSTTTEGLHDPARERSALPVPAAAEGRRGHDHPARRPGGRLRRGLLYRGSWCPYCNAQLAAFSRASAALEQAGARVVALSVDDEATSTALADKLRLTFPLGHSADADLVSKTLGSYVNDEPHYLQSTGFVLAPDGTVVTAVYSSGAIGRLLPDDVVGLVKYAKQHG